MAFVGMDVLKNTMLTAGAATGPYLSLHTALPNTSGSNEMTTAGSIYARKAVTWGTAASASIAFAAGTITFDVPAGQTVVYVGLWSASSGGSFKGYWNVSSVAYVGQGTYSVTSGSLTLTNA
jgi:hypothetical protein